MSGAHQHNHAPRHFGRAFAIGVTLNVVFVVIEAFYGWQAGSLALLADAAHNLSDVGGLLLAWAAFGAAQLNPNLRHSYGWRKGSILASFANAVILLVAMGSLAWEAFERLQAPSPVAAGTVMVVAGIGVVINAVTAWLFLAGSEGDLNIRGAFLHMAADALVSLGVVVAGAIYLWQGWGWIDPVMSLVIALVIVMGTWSLFRHSLHLLFDGVPEGIDLTEVQEALLELPGVVSVHDLHVWAMSTRENAITAHLVLAPGDRDNDRLLTLATDMLHGRFGIHHTVLQQESEAYAANCPTACGC
ncbi:cation diffusion facilitator family transporter [Marinobacter orientalis]|uniref:Cation transporter n=1 Tax=Marinobacter orientalis TaxID=1928859 RepID=A0A7Y0RAY3_9GAMM|nr:cation diffusion facilitator family transporter [Marinobacter orientalis]NMT62518.1 cation transporter [Marinobacter orientalis]TGX51213.1 cation transporter [Marinobacter orientalis]